MPDNDLISRKALSEEISSLTMTITGLRAGKGVLREFMTEYRKSVLRIVDQAPAVDALVLPCKVDDEVFVDIAGTIFPFNVISIIIHTGTPTFKAQHGIHLVWVFGVYDIGKTVFLTREEAEAALAERMKKDA